MSGICGWDGRWSREAAPDALSTMAARLSADPPPPRADAAGAHSALHLGARSGSDMIVEDGRRAAIDGDPYWTEAGLASVAAARGHAAALLEAWRRHGTGLFEFLHGPFSMAVLDE